METPQNSQVNITEVLQTGNALQNAPYLRNLYLKQADIEYQNGNIAKSVFYQTEALCRGYRCKYLINNVTSAATTNAEKKTSLPSFENPLVNYAKKCMSESTNTNATQNDQIFDTDPEKGVEALHDFIRSLPKEWTVIQLCKSYNPKTSCSLKSEIITARNSIYLSVLKSIDVGDVHPDTLCIKINPKQSGTDIFSLLYQITIKLKGIMGCDENDPTICKLNYAKTMAQIEEDIKKAIELLGQLIGPWRCFFSGPANPSSQDDAVFKQVNQFVADCKLNRKQRMILFNIARHACKLSDDYMIRVCSEITKDTEMFNQIKNFLVKMKKTFPKPLKCYPCIVIVDELLDHFFWETVNDEQEMCRISSLHLLKSIYSKYEGRVKNGYVHLPIKTGTWILNPDKTLNDMERRITSFVEVWNPKINCFVDRNPPNAEAISKYLGESDAFIYSGHGSGLQFFNGHKITNLNSKSVIFLLGCDSVRLKSDGMHSEMTGSHLYYFATKCPAVIGTILMAFDRRIDTMTTNILSIWIPTKNQRHWQSVNTALWAKEGKIEFENSGNQRVSYEPRLSRILCMLRKKVDTYHSRVYFVYRGLPVWNTNAT